MTITNKVSNKSVMPGVTAIPDVVDAPTIGTATVASPTTATVAFTAAATGGASTNFYAVSTPGSITTTSATSPITVSGLTTGTSYTFKTYGENSSGTWSAVQSAASNSITPDYTSAFESIATVTVGAGGSSTVTFSSIPQTYTHLQIRVTEQTNVFDRWRSIQFNGDTTTANYTLHSIYGTGSVVNVDWNSTSSDWYWYEAVSGHSTISMAGYIIDILDYTNTNKNKTIRFLGGHDNNGSGIVTLISKLWKNTSAINQIDLKVSSANFVQNSSFALYGIKSS